MSKILPLSDKRKAWAAKRETTLLGDPLNYNASQQIKYERALRELINPMIKDVKNKLTRLFDSKISDNFFEEQEKLSTMDASLTSKAKKIMNSLISKYTQLFGDKAQGIAETMIERAKKTSATNLHTSLKKLSGGLSLKTSTIPKGLEEVSKASIYENVQLIKSIANEYLDDVWGSVMRSITTGSGLADLIPALSNYAGITERRAKNIALDQTRKAYNSINKQRLLSIGVKKFKWLHSGGSQYPRKDHIEMNGNIYSFDDLPIIDKRTGERGIPGQAVNCRCRMNPVIELDNGQEV